MLNGGCLMVQKRDNGHDSDAYLRHSENIKFSESAMKDNALIGHRSRVSQPQIDRQQLTNN